LGCSVKNGEKKLFPYFLLTIFHAVPQLSERLEEAMSVIFPMIPRSE